MPMQVQMQAIEYMAAMQAPQLSDARADAAFAQSIATALAGLGKAEVVSGGRQIDVTMARGCDATLPKQAIAQHTSASLVTLLSHGVLVVRCADREVQCLQSTRDTDDVLCTHK
jgi:predicted Zn-dependent protease